MPVYFDILAVCPVDRNVLRTPYWGLGVFLLCVVRCEFSAALIETDIDSVLLDVLAEWLSDERVKMCS